MLSQKLTFIMDTITGFFQKLDDEVTEFARESGIQCGIGCGACCLSPEIETTVAEMLPMAWDFFQRGLGDQEYFALQDHKSKLCRQYQAHPDHPEQGRCSTYANRPALCRLFGYSAFRDRVGLMRFGACHKMHRDQAETVAQADRRVTLGDISLPTLSRAHERILEIGGALAADLLPINEALRRALEVIGLDMQLRDEAAEASL